MTPSIRLARPEDSPQIVALWKRFMSEEKAAVPKAEVRRVESGWVSRLQGQITTGRVLVAAHGQSLVGFLGFIDHADREWIPAGVAYVVDIYVVPEARSLHTTRKMFLTAAGLWRKTYPETWTNTHNGNRRLHVLLRRAGFKPLAGFEIPGLHDQMYYRLDNYSVKPAVSASRPCSPPAALGGGL